MLPFDIAYIPYGMNIMVFTDYDVFMMVLYISVDMHLNSILVLSFVWLNMIFIIHSNQVHPSSKQVFDKDNWGTIVKNLLYLNHNNAFILTTK